jgi:ubiquitin C-terminal hydrolase
MIETNFLIENMKEINPYEAMKKEIDSEKSIFHETDKINLNDLFNFYQASELYENSNSWFCANCNSNVRAIINKSLYSLPDVLIIHFQRKVNSIYNPIKIKFPIEGLNMSGYCYDNNSKKKLYDLVGIINFSGNSYTGHYNAFCKNDIHKKWFSFNDSMCSFIDNIEDEIKYDEVYILVYKNRYFQKVEFKEDKIE